MILYVPAIKELFKNEEDVLQEEKTQIGVGTLAKMEGALTWVLEKNFKSSDIFSGFEPAWHCSCKISGLLLGFFG